MNGFIEISVTWEPCSIWDSCTSVVFIPKDVFEVVNIDDYLRDNFKYPAKNWRLV